MFTFMGRVEDWPPYIFRPTWRLAYCTGIRRSAPLTQVISTISSRMPTMTSRTIHHFREPARIPPTIWDTMVGTRDRMPANRMMEMPLPIPNSVICSPIHITKEEPAMKDTMMTRAAHTDVLVRMP